VSWRPWLEDRALRQMQGLPPVPGRRVADLGDLGFIEFIVDEEERLVRVYHLVWIGQPSPIAAIGDSVDGEMLTASLNNS
jgi:hypothetical protein